MRDDSRVSIVIPNYNGMAYLESCLRALLADDAKAEILVVDNGSTDGSRELAEEKFPQVRVIALQWLQRGCKSGDPALQNALCDSFK